MQPNRFIPAGAGNTPQNLSVRCKRPVYHRWRGEHTSGQRRMNLPCGLSPLARGTPAQLPHALLSFRFIPAGAGNTANTTPALEKPPVYPRWRGEHENAHARERHIFGLSPLARGTPWQFYGGRARSRFIPAGAGNTPNPVRLISNPSVYPRWRGEHTKTIYLF